MVGFCNSLKSRPVNDAWLFGLCTVLLIVASATIAALAPVLFSIVTVFLFAAPHNWVELRYCLSRLPSRPGPLLPFFATSFGGLIILYASYLGLVVSARAHWLQYDQALIFSMVWNCSLIAWCFGLSFIRFESFAARFKTFGITILALAFSLLAPRWFALSLVYLHPFVGMFILERELRRTRKSWLNTYRFCLALIPLLICALVVQLSSSAPLEPATHLTAQITRHAGSGILPEVSSHLLVSLHTFLEMIHYGVWCIAIPVATNAVSQWRLNRFPGVKAGGPIKGICSLMLIGSTLLTLGFWFAFASDYSMTRDLYFTAAMIHVLAEVPLLMWMSNTRKSANRDVEVQVSTGNSQTACMS